MRRIASIIANVLLSLVALNLTPASAHDLTARELAKKPDSWYLKQVGGKRVTIDGHTLDLRIQYILAQFSKEEAEQKRHPEISQTATQKGRDAIRQSADHEWLSDTHRPPAIAWTKNYDIPRRNGYIHVRVYHPVGHGTFPTLVYFHGGGWFFGSVAGSDRSNQLLAADARMIVVAVDYRLAPEHPFPAAWHDAERAYGWVLQHAAELGGTPRKICIGGDSAGANLAIYVTRTHLAQQKAVPLCQLLYYPEVDARNVDTHPNLYKSARLFRKGFGLDPPFMDFILPAVFGNRNRMDPAISPLFAPSVRNMPPTFFGTSFFDPLRDSQRAYAARLIKAGVDVEFWQFPSLAHGFLQMTEISPAAQFAAVSSARAFGRFARHAEAQRKEFAAP